MKRYPLKVISNCIIVYILFFHLLVSCSLPDRSAKPYRSVKSLESALVKAVQIKNENLIKDRKVSRIAASAVGIKNKQNLKTNFRWIGREEINPSEFDKVIRSNSIIRNNWKNKWIETKGEGTSLIFVKKSKGDPFLMSAGEVMPVTAQIKKEDNDIILNLYDLFDLKNSSLNISRDHTAHINYLTRRSKLIPKITAVVNTNRYMNDIGLHRITPFDPDKIPVVLIHGFKDNQSSWVKLINQLQSDPEIRYRYQFWTFTYPTGIPVLYSAMRLREQLNLMKDLYDPMGTNPNLNKMVLVGHSMGGIIARLLSSNSNNSFSSWLPHQSLKNRKSSKFRNLANKMFEFEAQKFIGRTIFIATPHRGSELASSGIGKFFNTIIQVPLEIQNSFISTLNLNPNIPLNDQRLISRMKSIGNLSLNSDFIKSMQSTSMDQNIHTHSIIGIGKLSWWKKLESTNDFVVSYESSHLENTDSELTVSGWHDLQKNSKAISEVGRILKEHY